MLRELREAAGLSQGQVGRMFRLSRQAVGHWEAGDRLPEETRARKLDEDLRAGGMLLDAWRRARLAERARQDGTSLTEVIATDRREFGGASLAALIAAAVAASDEIATGGVTPMTLEEMEADAEDISASMYQVAPLVLLGRAASGWRDADALLSRRISGDVRPRVLLLAGTLACKTATLGRWTGDAAITRRFGVLAGQYADESGDPLLIGQVAGVRSRTAFSAGQFVKAADIAARSRQAAHPHARARLAAYEAEAWSAAGREAEARAALTVMREESRHATTTGLGATPWTDGDQVIFSAVALANLDDGQAAELAGRYVIGADNDAEGVGWAHVVAGRALVAGRRPDPVAAAHAGGLALAATAAVPNLSVISRVADLHSTLATNWPDADGVGELGDAVGNARAGLAT